MCPAHIILHVRFTSSCWGLDSCVCPAGFCRLESSNFLMIALLKPLATHCWTYADRIQPASISPRHDLTSQEDLLPQLLLAEAQLRLCENSISQVASSLNRIGQQAAGFPGLLAVV